MARRNLPFHPNGIFGLLAMAAMLLHFPAFANEPGDIAGRHLTLKSPVLQGNVREAVYDEDASGYVTQAGSNEPVTDATVSIPALGYTTKTGRDGGFTLPPLPGKPVIAGITKQGFVPRTVTLDHDPATTLRITLREMRQTVVLDNQIRHLGDGSYSPVSAGAGDFRRKAEGIKLVRRFTLPAPVKNAIYLQIGSIVGLDTAAAHRTGQSSFHRVSTPMIIRLNGKTLAEVQTNGDGLRIPIAPQLLNPAGANTLEIVTGYQIPDGAYVDYDDIELMLLTLDY